MMMYDSTSHSQQMSLFVLLLIIRRSFHSPRALMDAFMQIIHISEAKKGKIKLFHLEMLDQTKLNFSFLLSLTSHVE